MRNKDSSPAVRWHSRGLVFGGPCDYAVRASFTQVVPSISCVPGAVLVLGTQPGNKTDRQPSFGQAGHQAYPLGTRTVTVCDPV